MSVVQQLPLPSIHDWDPFMMRWTVVENPPEKKIRDETKEMLKEADLSSP
ncbi:unnamed protein product [Arabis nemorensis]|uniref:Uncharacterized protein n=1 Tax=Arabis nemorensis TaxID=586526 RepID=A0A565BSB8_9BRAS|nr:unnamed protein product [Arabis nemorensis]